MKIRESWGLMHTNVIKKNQFISPYNFKWLRSAVGRAHNPLTLGGHRECRVVVLTSVGHEKTAQVYKQNK